MRLIGNETVTLLSEPETDPYGDIVPGTGTETIVHGAAVYPNTSTEQGGRSGTVVEGVSALLPIDADLVTPGMKLRHRGKVYEVQGEPGRWTFMDGGAAGTQVTLRKVTG